MQDGDAGLPGFQNPWWQSLPTRVYMLLLWRKQGFLSDYDKLILGLLLINAGNFRQFFGAGLLAEEENLAKLW